MTATTAACSAEPGRPRLGDVDRPRAGLALACAGPVAPRTRFAPVAAGQPDRDQQPAGPQVRDPRQPPPGRPPRLDRGEPRGGGRLLLRGSRPARGARAHAGAAAAARAGTLLRAALPPAAGRLLRHGPRAREGGGT